MLVSRRRILRVTAGGGLALAGCTGTSGSGQAPTGTSSPTPTSGADGSSSPVVEMVNTGFDPVRASVEPGTTVEWVNEDGFEHDVTAAQFHDSAADWSFSETLSSGGRAEFTFEESGVYEYYCTIHSKGSMCGAVLVGEATLDPSLPCESGGDDDSGSGYY